MVAKNPSGDVVAFLAAQIESLNSSGSSQNIAASSVRIPSSNVPKISVFVMDGPGAAPIRVMSQATEHRMPIVHVTVRHTKYQEGITLMQDIIDVMQGASISGYLDVASISSGPLQLPRDTESLHAWNNSFILTYEQGA